jgi:uncharacterized protein
MQTIHITLLFVGILAILQCVLTALVIARRLKAKVSLLDGGDKPLTNRMRAHGNFTETVPIAIIMMAFLEMRGIPSVWLWVIGISLTLGRVLHAVCLTTRKPSWGRPIGMGLTVAVISLQGVACVWIFFSPATALIK